MYKTSQRCQSDINTAPTENSDIEIRFPIMADKQVNEGDNIILAQNAYQQPAIINEDAINPKKKL